MATHYHKDNEDLPTNCFACNNPFKNDEKVFQEDGEWYCADCAQDIGLDLQDKIKEQGSIES